MPPSPALIARDQRILAGHAAGATILDLAIAEEIDPAVVRRVLRAAGITPGPLHPPTADPAADASATGALADSTWLAAEYATKSAKQIARELGCSNDRVYAALRTAGFPMHGPGRYPPPMEITGETAERVVTLYLAGASAQDIAGELSVSAPRVLRFLEERGVKRTKSEVGSLAYAYRRAAASRKPKSEKEPAKPRRKWVPELEPEVLERYAAGESGEAIADQSARWGGAVERVPGAARARRAAVEAGGGADAAARTVATGARAQGPRTRGARDHAGRIGGGGAEALCGRRSAEADRRWCLACRQAGCTGCCASVPWTAVQVCWDQGARPGSCSTPGAGRLRSRSARRSSRRGGSVVRSGRRNWAAEVLERYAAGSRDRRSPTSWGSRSGGTIGWCAGGACCGRSARPGRCRRSGAERVADRRGATERDRQERPH